MGAMPSRSSGISGGDKAGTTPGRPDLKLVHPPTEGEEVVVAPKPRGWVEKRFGADKPIDTMDYSRSTFSLDLGQWQKVFPHTKLESAGDYQALVNGSAIVVLQGPAVLEPGTAIALDSTRPGKDGTYVGSRYAMVARKVSVPEGGKQVMLLGSDGELHCMIPQVPKEISNAVPRDAQRKPILPTLRSLDQS